jgi:hypothetical protein
MDARGTTHDTWKKSRTLQTAYRTPRTAYQMNKDEDNK